MEVSLGKRADDLTEGAHGKSFLWKDLENTVTNTQLVCVPSRFALLYLKIFRASGNYISCMQWLSFHVTFVAIVVN